MARNPLVVFGAIRRLLTRSAPPARIGQPRRVPMGRIFAAARVDRLSLDWLSSLGSGEADVKVDLSKLRGRSRTVTRDTPEGKRFCGLFEENVIGPNGIRLVPRVKTNAGEYDRTVNDAIAAAWALWGEPENCTVDGSASWLDVQHTVARTEPMDGEYVIRLVTGADNPFGFAVQLLDPDQLDVEYSAERIDTGGRIVQGVELSRLGKVVAYHIWDGHPNDGNKGRRRRIPADQIVHDFIPWRIGAKRGIPWLHAGLQAIHMLGGYQEAELVAARDGAANPGFFEAGPDAGADDEEEAAEVPLYVEPGTNYKLPVGYKYVGREVTHPTSAFDPFMKSINHRVAMSGQVSYMSLSGDLSDTSYSSGRIGLLAERDRYKMLQGRYAMRLHRRVYRAWLKASLLTGALPLPAAALERYYAVVWQPRGFPWIDPVKDIDAFEREVKLGLNSRTAGCNERGRDFEEILAELDHEQQLADEYGISIEGSATPPQYAADPAMPKPTTPAQTDNGQGKGRLRVS